MRVGHDTGLSYQNRLAERNRGFSRAKGVFVVNLLSFAGSGARQLVDRTLAELGGRLRIATLTSDLLARILELSPASDAGMDAWYAYLSEGMRK